MARPKKETVAYEYKPADRYIILNKGDQDLFPIKVDLLDLLQRLFRFYGLPEPKDFPAFEKVYGYGVEPKEQVFEREVIPQKLILLEKHLRNELAKERRLSSIKIELTLINQFWDTLDANQEKYKDEIEWLRLQWYYRLFGKFIFINGRVTWILPSQHFFLNWWSLDNIIPEYRDADREMEIGALFAELDTTTFAHIDPDTKKPVPNEQGEYEMMDTGARVCLGVNDAKARRVGDTSRFQSKGYEKASRTLDFHFGTQGRDEPHAKKVFQENLMKPFSKLPIFWKPVWDAALGVKPKEHLLFDGESADFGLRTRVTHALSANAENYNGDKLHYYHRDEAGNSPQENVNKGHQIVKFCLTLGDKIIGFAAYTTTVEEISDRSAGENYMLLCMDSKYEMRNENNRTTSGLYNVFIKAERRVEGYIDKYGMPIIGKPTPEQEKFIGKNYGSRQFIENTIKDLKRKKDWEGLAVFQRQFPQSFRDCFSPPAKNQFWDTESIRNRIQYLTFSAREELPRRGNLVRTAGPDSDVEWRDDERFGRWYLSYDFAPYETNQRFLNKGIWFPMNPYKVVVSADTFGMDRTLGRASLGGITVRLRFDPTIDNEKADSSTWKTGRTIMTYSNRPDTVEDFCEDALMTCVFVNGMMYGERNKDNINVHFKRRKHGGYLLFDRDKYGNPVPEAGFWTNKDVKIKIFNLVKTQVLREVSRCPHIDLMQEMCNIRNPEDMTNFDLFTSNGGTLLAELNPFYEMQKYYNTRIDVSGVIPMKRY